VSGSALEHALTIEQRASTTGGTSYRN
jgi:hypothetical protein